jgi:hypothetical protein
LKYGEWVRSAGLDVEGCNAKSNLFWSEDIGVGSKINLKYIQEAKIKNL